VAAAVVLGAAVAWLGLARGGRVRAPAALPSTSSVPESREATPPPPTSASADAPRWSGAGAITPELTAVTDDTSFELLTFPVDVERARLRVVDLGMTRDLERALHDTGASLVVNGGFFDPQQRPEGLVVSEGVVVSAHSEPLGGGVVAIARGRASLEAAEGYATPPEASFALQARPRLVVGGTANVRHDDGRHAERTALCLRDGGHALEVIVARGDVAGAGPTLSLFADMLASRGCEGALNLDGGPSTGVVWRGRDAIHVLAPRGPLRHAVAIWTPEGAG
jgi:hypothetical protein